MFSRTQTHMHWHDYVAVHLIIKKKEGRKKGRRGEKERGRKNKTAETEMKSVKNKSCLCQICTAVCKIDG